jgi:hypothetical protein
MTIEVNAGGPGFAAFGGCGVPANHVRIESDETFAFF